MRALHFVFGVVLAGFAFESFAVCPAGTTQFYQVTSKACPVPSYCTSGQASLMNAEIGDQNTLNGISNKLESILPSGSATVNSSCYWQGINISTATEVAKVAKTLTGAPCSSSQSSFQIGDYCVAQPTPPPPDVCSSTAGVIKSFTPGGSGLTFGQVPNSVCRDGCSYTLVMAGGASDASVVWFGTYRGGGTSCTGSNNLMAPDTVDTMPDGQQGYGGDAGNGTAAHGDSNETNCGYVNGQRVCTGTSGDAPAPTPTAENPCVTLADGTVVCSSWSPTPPRPDSGTAGVPAPADNIITLTSSGGATTVFHAFKPETVINSTGGYEGTGSGTGAGGTTGGTTGSGSGTCTDDPSTSYNECGEGGQGGGMSAVCSAEPSCSDATTIECAILRQQWKDTCRTYDVAGASEVELAAAAGVAEGTDAEAVESLRQEVEFSSALGLPAIPGMSTSACPVSPTFSFNGSTFTFDVGPLCDFLRIAGVFVVMVAVFAAFRIAFGSA